MATRPPAPDYSGRDYDSALTRLRRLVQSIFPSWTDFNKPNFGNMLIRCLAFIVDIISKYTDFMANEGLPEHAKLRRSVVAHSRWISYELSGRTAAISNQTFTVAGGAHPVNIVLPEGTLLRSADSVNPIEYQLLNETTIPAGTVSVNANVEHSENAEDEEVSTTLPNQIFTLSQEPYISDSMAVSAADGAYTRVQNFLSSSETDKHFTVEIDDQERPVVRFGNGVNGKIPEGVISFEYKVGGGFEGNVDPGTITEILDPLVDIEGTPVTINTTNAERADGGADPETVAQAKQRSREEIRVGQNSVAREDYEIVARGINGVAHALFLTAKDTVTIRENEGVAWVVGLGDQTASGAFRAAVPSEATVREVEEAWRTTRPKTESFYARAVGQAGGVIKPVDIYVTVHLNDSADRTISVPGQATNIGLLIFNTLDDFFAVQNADGSLSNNIDFGFNVKKADGTPIAELEWGTVYNVINDLAGVRKIDCDDLLLNNEAKDVTMRIWQLPQLGSVVVIDKDTNQQLYPAV